MVEIKVCQMLKMHNSNYGFTVETKRVHNVTMPFVQKIVRKSFDNFFIISGHFHNRLFLVFHLILSFLRENHKYENLDEFLNFYEFALNLKNHI